MATTTTTTTTTSTSTSSRATSSNNVNNNVNNSILNDTLPIVKLDIRDIKNLNYNVDDFIKEQDLHSSDENKNKLFLKLIEPTRESYENEIKLIETHFDGVKEQLMNLFPPGNYPKEVYIFIKSHLQYMELCCNKVKCGLRARVFDLIQNVFNQNINIGGGALLTAADAALANSNATITIAAANVNKQHSLGKKKRKIDINLDRWYDKNSINGNPPYPMYSDKIFLAAISKISKNKVEEWMGNKRTRSKRKLQSAKNKESGAALIKNPSLAQEIINATRDGLPIDKPVGVKTRIGFDKIEIDQWIPALLECKASCLSLHLRTKKELSLVPAHLEHEILDRVVELRNQISPETLLVENGDVES